MAKAKKKPGADKQKKPSLKSRKKPPARPKKKPLLKMRKKVKPLAKKKPKITPPARSITPAPVLLPKPMPVAQTPMIRAPAGEKKPKEEKPEEELTPEEKIERMFPEEKEEEEKPEKGKKEGKQPAEEKKEEIVPEAPPGEKPEYELEELPEEKPEEKEKPEEVPAEEEKPEEKGEEEKEKPEKEEKPEEVPAEEEKPEEKGEEEAERPKFVAPRPEPLARPRASGEVVPVFEMLPDWEDRRRLRRAVEEGGISVSAPAKGSREMKEALKLLPKRGEAAGTAPGYSLVCARDAAGRLAAAADFCVIKEDGTTLLALIRSSVFVSDGKRDLHMILYAAALSVAKPSHVICRIPHPDFSKPDDFGRMIFFGRGLGMSAIPLNHPKMLYFIRRIGKEYEPVMFGEQIASIVNAANRAYQDKVAARLAAGLAAKGGIALVMMPASPDYGEHLHELKDSVIALGLSTAELDSSFAMIESQYLRGRADITPSSLF